MKPTPFIFTPRQTSKFFDRLEALGYVTTSTAEGTVCVGQRTLVVSVTQGRMSVAMTAEESARAPARVAFEPAMLLEGPQGVVERAKQVRVG